MRSLPPSLPPLIAPRTLSRNCASCDLNLLIFLLCSCTSRVFVYSSYHDSIWKEEPHNSAARMDEERASAAAPHASWSSPAASSSSFPLLTCFFSFCTISMIVSTFLLPLLASMILSSSALASGGRFPVIVRPG